jgi:uncharacterized protein (TIGR02452 family)
MPTHRQKAAAASAETRSLFGDLAARTGCDPTSYSYPYTNPLPNLPSSARHQLRSAVMEGDPFDIARDWQNYTYSPSSSGRTVAERAPPVYFKSIMQSKSTSRILVLNTANEKKPGGDWDGGVLGLGAEESLARRSNLVQTLCTVDPRNPGVRSYYPIPQTGGIYSPNCVIFRAGYEKDYALWPENEWTAISVVSVAAVRRPKTDESGTRYSFVEEKELQKEKMRTVLRIAGWNGHLNLVLGGFGSCGPGTGSGDGKHLGYGGGGSSNGSPRGSTQMHAIAAANSTYKNPIRDVCKMWKELLFEDDEFQGYFANAVFAVGGEGGGQREFGKYFG